MRSDYIPQFGIEIDDGHEKLRRDAMRTIEQHGRRGVTELAQMSEGERVKWFLWNIHENLEEYRKLEPNLVGQVMCTTLSITDGLSLSSEKLRSEKSIALSCRWYLRLAYSSLQNEEMYPLGLGNVDLAVSSAVPQEPPLRKNQKGYLDADNSLYPHQLYVYGWVPELIWDELKTHLYSPIPNCQTDLILREACLFPVKQGFEFVSGPPGGVGITNLEFRVSSHASERRSARRSEMLQR